MRREMIDTSRAWLRGHSIGVVGARAVVPPSPAPKSLGNPAHPRFPCGSTSRVSPTRQLQFPAASLLLRPSGQTGALVVRLSTTPARVANSGGGWPRACALCRAPPAASPPCHAIAEIRSDATASACMLHLH